MPSTSRKSAPLLIVTLMSVVGLIACTLDGPALQERWRGMIPALPAVRAALAPVVSGAQQASRDGCPLEMARMGAVCIDRFEAHVVEQVDGTDRVHPFNEPLCGKEDPSVLGLQARRRAERECEGKLRRMVARSSPDVFPQGYISQLQAERACFNAGKRLCTRSEWRAGCQGSRKTQFPYGTRLLPGACNNGKAHVLTLLHGASPGGWSYQAFNDERLNAQEGFLEKTGAMLDCVSDVGLFDMVGNLQEWVTNRVEYGPYMGRGVFVGSHFGNRGDESGLGCDYQIRAHEPSYHDYSIGFRCCKNAE